MPVLLSKMRTKTHLIGGKPTEVKEKFQKVEITSRWGASQLRQLKFVALIFLGSGIATQSWQSPVGFPGLAK
jgi:hypothetical protein